MGRLNDGSEKGEDARQRAIRSISFRVCGGSDSQRVTIDVCATEFTAPIRAMEVREVRKGPIPTCGISVRGDLLSDL